MKVKLTRQMSEHTTGMYHDKRCEGWAACMPRVSCLCYMLHLSESLSDIRVLRFQQVQAYVPTDLPCRNPVAPGSALSVQHGTVPCGADEPQLPLLAAEHHASTLGVGTHACTGFKTTSEQQRG